MSISDINRGFWGIIGGAHEIQFVNTVCLPSRHGEFYANAKCDSIKVLNLPTNVSAHLAKKDVILYFFDSLLTQYFSLIT